MLYEEPYVVPSEDAYGGVKTMKIILLPLEPLEIRYTAQWDKWFPQELDRLKADYRVIKGIQLTGDIKLGDVLDAYGTNYWKATQMANLIRAMYRGEVTSDDVLLFADLWSPGIEALRYISDMGGVKPKITGILHAGTWDPNDFTYRNKMRPWAHGIEDSWFKIFDKIFVGSYYHRDLIMQNHTVDEQKIVVTGLPFYPEDFTARSARKSKYKIAFPHRLAPEKHPEEFGLLLSRHRKLVGTMTAEHFTTKEEYYHELANSSIAVSFADQETFGYAMLEATALWNIPLVPDRLSYKELYPKLFRYNSLIDLDNKIRAILRNGEPYYDKLGQVQEKHKSIGHNAILNMVRSIITF